LRAFSLRRAAPWQEPPQRRAGVVKIRPDVIGGNRVALAGFAAAALALVAALGSAAAPPLAAAPNDPGWPGQWGLRSSGFPAVWRQVAPSARPVVAIVDTGVRPGFLDLKGALVPGWDLLAQDARPRDTAGHGTNVAAVLAARANNLVGLAGACPVCRVMPVRISKDGKAAPDMIAAGIRWAVDHGARIVNVSLVASGDPDPGEQAAVAYAAAKGAVVVAAAGNDGKENPRFPAALDPVVSVAGATKAGTLYRWTTRGRWVTFAAPGCMYFERMCGSSYGPPVVSAAIALLLAAHPGAAPVQALQALRQTARPVSGVGVGLIDVARASAALGTPQPLVRAPSAQTTVFEGAFARKLTAPLSVDAGEVVVRLQSADLRDCSLTLRSGASVTTVANGATELRVAARLPAGRASIEVACATAAARAYTLTTTGPVKAVSPSS
jgi:subtilisin family serine protease